MEIWNCTAAEYHADLERESHSSLELFRKSIEEYAAVRVWKTQEPMSPTPAMVLGSAFHSLVLEPEKFQQEYVVSPEGIDRRTKEGKRLWAEFEQQSQGKTPISVSDMAKLNAMREGLFRNAEAKKLMESQGVVEQSVIWEDYHAGISLKCRPDKTMAGTLIDLKTTTDVSPEKFGKTAFDLGYHRQAALYLSAFFDYSFCFIAVSKDPPHETVTYWVDPHTQVLGLHQCHDAMQELFLCRQNNNWGSRWAGRQNLTLPAWAWRHGRYDP